MAEPPVETSRTMLYFVDGALAYAGPYVHERGHPMHTHSFFEVAVVTGGEGVHQSLAGRQQLRVGDVILLRPGVWHSYEDCRDLRIYNCCFAADLLQRELAWTREDPLLGYLLWTGPFSAERRGILTTHLDAAPLHDALDHLQGLEELRDQPVKLHRGDIVGRLSLFLSCVARALEGIGTSEGETHPAVLAAMRRMEADPAHQWTLTELASELHLAPGYLVRLFKSSTGLPPMAYLSRHRVELAADLLLHTDLAICRIGEAVGWPDQNYFARRFKSHYGLTASNYRASFTHPGRTGAVPRERRDSAPARTGA
ncbi:AraC family L-rhamnose operon transcriptional activator RhaR [Kribbella amoyensis]|uniref:AraC family L-rhamnose operon transcriptional activator RhaR n=1 Tax=Kribbella amoyensis TaxID=996641 RepID=A0A561BZL2_9ACTN|nr:AraC family transcriptional regulator [Kribbella amoyensis]TWD84247.1 AraC family L-rhamnose operon transcriptional activator RhaR [Kribbella amoyensis]